jgi:hypothetical protein
VGRRHSIHDTVLVTRCMMIAMQCVLGAWGSWCMRSNSCVLVHADRVERLRFCKALGWVEARFDESCEPVVQSASHQGHPCLLYTARSATPLTPIYATRALHRLRTLGATPAAVRVRSGPPGMAPVSHDRAARFGLRRLQPRA